MDIQIKKRHIKDVEQMIDKVLFEKLKSNAQALKEYSLRKIKQRQDTYMTLNERLNLADQRKFEGKINYFHPSCAIYLKSKKNKKNENPENEFLKNLPDLGEVHKDIIEI